MLKRKWKKIKYWFLRLWHLRFNNEKTVKFKFSGKGTVFLLGEYVQLSHSEYIYQHLGQNTFLITELKLKDGNN